MPQIGSLFVALGMDTARFNAQAQGAAAALLPIEANSRKVTFALTNLGFQINDIASGLASGQAPARIFAQQFGQIIQAFTQGGGFSVVMRGASQAIRDFITPMRVATGVVGLVAAGVGVLAARVLSSEDRIRGFNVMLKGMGDTGKQTGADLEAAAKRLRDVGLSTADAVTAMQAARRAGIAPGQAERITRIGQNLIPVLGENAPQQLVGAIAGGVESLGALALQLGVVSAREVEAARETVRLTGHFQELENWVKRIEERTKGLNQEALSPFAKSMRDLSIAWGQMLDAMSKTAPIMLAVKALKELAEIMTFVATLGKSGGVGEAGGALAGGVAGAMAGRFFGPYGAVLGGLFGAGIGGYAGAVGPKAPVAEAAIPGGRMPTADALRLIMQFESGGQNIKNPKSTASGYFQFLDSTWKEIAPQVGIDIRKYPTAMSASYALQEAAATKLYEQRGFQPWTVGNPKLAAHLAAGGGPQGVLAQSDLDRQKFVAAREAQFRTMTRETTNQTQYENAVARMTREGQGARGLSLAQAAMEGTGRYAESEAGSAEARAEMQARAAQFLAFSQARGRRSLAEGGEADRQTTEQLAKQAELFGKATHEIDLQVTLLRIRQQAEQAGLDVTDQAVKAREEEAKKLAEANRLITQQQKLMQQVREVAGVFENAFGQIFDSIAQGTFNLRKSLAALLADLGKTLASSAFKRLLGGDNEGGGFLGFIAKSIWGIGSKSLGGGSGPFGDNWSSAELGMTGYATGGSFRVGGYGAMDSQLMAFRASPGEMIDVTPSNQAGGRGRGEVITIDLNPSEGWVSGIADQRIVTRSGQIIDVAVRQSQKTVARNFAGMTTETQARQM